MDISFYKKHFLVPPIFVTEAYHLQEKNKIKKKYFIFLYNIKKMFYIIYRKLVK